MSDVPLSDLPWIHDGPPPTGPDGPDDPADVALYSADDTIEVNGRPTRIGDLPPDLRASLGVGHFPGHGRAVVTVPGRTWPHTPDMCLTDLYRGEWITPETLVCTGCGLDCT